MADDANSTQNGDSAAIIIRLRTNAQFMTGLYWRFRRGHRLWIAGICLRVLALAVTIPLLILTSIAGAIIPALIFFGVSAMTAFWPWIGLRISLHNLRRSPYCDDEASLAFSKDGVDIQSTKESAKVSWAAFTEAVHFRDGFLLFRGPAYVQWIPVSALADPAQLPALENLLKTHIAAHRVIAKASSVGA